MLASQTDPASRKVRAASVAHHARHRCFHGPGRRLRESCSTAGAAAGRGTLDTAGEVSSADAVLVGPDGEELVIVGIVR
ncbi:hypothetical protein [Dactylosporangium cerinum]